MFRPSLVLYDNNGKVWGLFGGVSEVPPGVLGVITDTPANYNSVQVNPITKEVTFELAPVTEDEVTNLQEALRSWTGILGNSITEQFTCK